VPPSVTVATRPATVTVPLAMPVAPTKRPVPSTIRERIQQPGERLDLRRHHRVGH